jgi:hypothetical protein
MKKLIYISSIFLTFASFAQVANNGSTQNTASATSAFINASVSTFQSLNGFSQDGTGNNGKSLVFPRTDLTQFTFATFSPGDFPSNFDAAIVYNSGTGTTPASGSGVGNQPVTPGFYYFSNPGSSFNTNSGQWLPFDNGSTRTDVVNNTVNNTNTIINGVPENVVRLDGTTGGTRTEITLDPAVISAGTVAELREARIYDQTGKLLMIASSDYDATTNIMTTGDGMVNKLLPAGTYTVELFFLPTVTP